MATDLQSREENKLKERQRNRKENDEIFADRRMKAFLSEERGERERRRQTNGQTT